MLWKNLIVLAGLVWFTSSYAADPVMEDMDDALSQRYEEPFVKKDANRDVAQEPELRDPASVKAKEEPGQLKYWKYEEPAGSRD